MSLEGKPDQAPTGPDTILEGVIVIDSEDALEAVTAVDADINAAEDVPGHIDRGRVLESVVDEEINPVSAAEEVSESSTIVEEGVNSVSVGEEGSESRTVVDEEVSPAHAGKEFEPIAQESTSRPESEHLPVMTALETEPDQRNESQVEDSVDSKDGSVLQRDVTPASEEPTSSDGDLKLGENIVVLLSKSSAPGGQCRVYLVGTAHVSQESCDEVKKVIRHVKPQVVFVELCTSRASMLRPQTLQIPTLEEMINMYRTKGMNLFGIIYSWFLAKVADKLEVYPGAEFRVAYEEAIACGARVCLGDRPVQGFFMPGAEDLNQMVEQMKDTDMVTAIIQEMSKTFPTLMDTLVHERDLYMTATLRGVAQNCATAVAVVGKGHLQGITKNWEKNIPIETLMTVPEKKKSWLSQPAVRWGALTLAAGGLAIFIGVRLNPKL